MSKTPQAPGKREPIAAGGQTVTGATPQSHLAEATLTVSHLTRGTNKQPTTTESAKINKKNSHKATTAAPSQDSPPSSNDQITKLIGRKALTKCLLNGLAVTALVNTGAQVSIVERSWKDKYLPDLEVRPISELMELVENETQLDVYAADGELIPFEGWVVITVNLPGNEDPNLSINVPFLVSSVPLEVPLIGFNVVESVIQGKPERLIPILTQLLGGAMSIPNDTAKTIVHCADQKN